MAAINHNLTEQEIVDIRHASLTIQNKMYPDDPAYADEGSRQITIGVFRNLIEPTSVYIWIANRMKKVFVVDVEKGHGNLQ